MFWTGMIIGYVIGAVSAIFVIGLLTINRDADEPFERFRAGYVHRKDCKAESFAPECAGCRQAAREAASKERERIENYE